MPELSRGPTGNNFVSVYELHPSYYLLFTNFLDLCKYIHKHPHLYLNVNQSIGIYFRITRFKFLDTNDLNIFHIIA